MCFLRAAAAVVVAADVGGVAGDVEVVVDVVGVVVDDVGGDVGGTWCLTMKVVMMRRQLRMGCYVQRGRGREHPSDVRGEGGDRCAGDEGVEAAGAGLTQGDLKIKRRN